MSTHSNHARPSGPEASDPRPLSAGRLRWLQAEISGWEQEGLVCAQDAAHLRSRYVASTRNSLLRIVVGLGAAFLAVGLLWLVATNLDELAPLARLAAVAAIWLALVVVAQLLRARGASTAPSFLLADRDGDEARAPSLAAVCQVLAAAAFGAVIFQAAQSLQVPAYEPRLVGLWGLGALLYAYVTRSHGALAVALAAATVWLGWFTGASALSTTVAALMVLAAAVVAIAIAVAHAHLLPARPGFAHQWRFVGTGLALAGVFIAAFPYGWSEKIGRSEEFIALLVAAVLSSLFAIIVIMRRGTGSMQARSIHAVEICVAWLILAGGSLLAWWRPDHAEVMLESASMSPEMWARTTAGLLLFIAAVAWFAVLGTRREAPEVTTLALVGLLLFTTVQSFAVFAPIASGASLFLAVGAVMLTTGLAAERIRRMLGRLRPRSRRRQGRRRSGAKAQPPPDETLRNGEPS